MMAYEQKDNSGSLFKNERREKDTHAHARGSSMIDGVEYYIDAWTNTTAKGDKYQSLKFKRKEQAQPGARDRQHQQGLGRGGFAPSHDDLSDEVPF